MLDFYSTGLFLLSILEVMQIQIWKKGKEKGPSIVLYKIVLFIFKSLFLGKLISSALFPFMKIWKTRKKCFSHSVFSAHVSFTIFSQGGFYRTEKENLIYLYNTIEGKTKTNFCYGTLIFSKQNKIQMNYKRNVNKTLFVKYVLLYSCNKASTGFFRKYSLAFNVSKRIKYTLSFSVCYLNCKDRLEQTKIVFWKKCPASWIFFDLSVRLTN